MIYVQSYYECFHDTNVHCYYKDGEVLNQLAVCIEKKNWK